MAVLWRAIVYRTVGILEFWFVVLSVFAVNTACVSAGNDTLPQEAFNQRIRTQEVCLGGLKADLRSLLSASPAFNSLPEAVHWSQTHIPKEIQKAIQQAGQDVIKNSPGSLNTIAQNDKDMLWKIVGEAVFLRLANMPEHQNDGCAAGTEEVLANNLDINLNFESGPLHTKFENLNITDSYQIDYAFLYMMVLDSTGLQWSEDWFHGFHH